MHKPISCYTLEGKQGAPVLVLANSLGASASMWDAQMPAWRRQFQVLRYDYRGHGETAAAGDAGSIALLAQDLLALLDSLHIARFRFLGLSLGGMLGLHLAATVPERVERLAAANCRYYQTEDGRRQWDERIAAVRSQGIDAIVDATADRWLSPEFRRAHPQRDAAIRSMIRSTSVDGYAACASAVRDFDARPMLDRIGCPLLLVSGASDVAAPAAHIAELAATLPNATHLPLAGAHLSNIENDTAFTNAITSFMGEDMETIRREAA